MACFDGCHCLSHRRRGSILYSILKNDGPAERAAHRRPEPPVPPQACSCASNRRVALRSPQVTCKAASAVLVKTLRFVKNVPCFRELPADDQLLLVRSSWAPLLVLGLAQDRVDFETTESAEPSMLQRILTGGRDEDERGDKHGAHRDVSLADIHAIKAFLNRCWGLDISTKEYAYLKGAVLFNPDLAGLRCLQHICGLQREAHRALDEHVRMMHRADGARSARLFVALSTLRSISARVVAELFFRPVIGTVDMEELLLDLFYGK
ncbi:nuclear receptor subfamily 0 group B member 1 [Scleropages formosus]|uniref:nuclear receptor subfamily 0 group B member 1 n=1 Tax=Scleropages formosus TaxID=113540 RepID=UPI0010FA91DA|nr:nuclear receptor subfamily 0 group B member 1-like [Scleropages formosus]